MSSSAINQGVLSAKISNVQNVGDSSAVCSTTGDWSFKNATATATNVFISNAGNVGVGTTSPSHTLVLNQATDTRLRFENAGTAGGQLQLTSNEMRLHAISTNILGLWTNGQERMRIDASGNVGIGATIVSSKLDVQKDSAATNPSSDQTFPAWTSGAVLKNAAAIDGAYSGLSFLTSNLAGTTQGFSIVGQSTNSGFSSNLLFMARTASGTTTERMRIDASGNLLVGAASAYNALAKLQVISSGANNGMLATTDGATQSPYLSWNRATSGNNIFLYCTTEATGSFGTERGSIYYDRAANQTKIAATSDERLKTNIKDAPSLLEKVCAIKVREYAWKETGSENIGFIAQELNAVVPRAVWEGEDNEDGTIKRPWSVDNPTLVPYLVKAIQELSAKVDAQAAEIEALKASAVPAPSEGANTSEV